MRKNTNKIHLHFHIKKQQHSLHCPLSSIMDRVAKISSQRAVVIFSKSTCCMCHAIKRLFYEQGVSPLIHELDEDSRGKELESALMKLGCSPAAPAVFIGGKLVGSANTVMTLQLNGSLKMMLKDAGALWL
ncbi:monothiol glutaredoxin-S10-like [Salvia hispanica]|nr:monothiol glutaredoxin-S10-like [Salvia hispanica]